MAAAYSSFKKINTQDSELNRVQDNVDDALTIPLRSSIVNGQLLTGIVISAGDNVINHGLNRKCMGYIVTSTAAAATFSDAIPQGNNLSFILGSNVASTINLWVF